jgi:DNA-binding transcriptional ArsR family regulator
VQAFRDDAWAALGDRTRRTIFRRVARRPCAVGEIARDVPVTRAAVSQHLKVLKEAGLVLDRAEGTRRIYRVDTQGLERLRADLDEFWSSALAAYRDTIEHRMKESE